MVKNKTIGLFDWKFLFKTIFSKRIHRTFWFFLIVFVFSYSLAQSTDQEDDPLLNGGDGANATVMPPKGGEQSKDYGTAPKVQGHPITPKYVQIFKEMGDLSNLLASYVKTANGVKDYLSWGVSTALTLGSVPMSCILGGALPYLGLTSLGVPHPTARDVSIGIGAVVAPIVTLGTCKMGEVIRKEYDQFLDWFYKPRNTTGYYGERLAPVAMRAVTVSYVVLETVNYLNQDILIGILGIDNATGRVVLIIPFVAGPIYSVVAQFFETQGERIANWFATGAEINLSCCNKKYRIFRFLDSDGTRKKGLEMLKKIRSYGEKIENMGWDHFKVFAKQAGLAVRKKYELEEWSGAEESCFEPGCCGGGAESDPDEEESS